MTKISKPKCLEEAYQRMLEDLWARASEEEREAALREAAAKAAK